jgi:thioredoxin-related protein
MKNVFLSFALALALFLSPKFLSAQEVKWYTIKEAIELNKTNPKKIYIDVYTDWCGWCKRMDANTFTNPVIVALMNHYFYCVKYDAEVRDTLVVNNVRYINEGQGRSAHQFAQFLLNGRLSYPTTVFLDEKNNSIVGPVAGYLDPPSIEPILIYIGEEVYKKMKWEDFKNGFKGELNKAN